MKIKLIAQYVGPRGVFNPGTIIDVPDVEAEALVQGRYALPVVEKSAAPAPAAPAPVAVETADLPVPEQAVKPSRKRKA